MGYSKKITYLSQAQYDTLVTNGSLTVNKTTITYNADDLYVTPQPDPISYVQIVSGTTPVITGVANIRYNCGEVSSITIIPPSSGIIDVTFTSGSTPALLTATGVNFPEWFDADNLDTNTIYEINIADGTRGAVMAWPVS